MDDWMKWQSNSGKAPVDGDIFVRYHLRSGRGGGPEKAKDLDWLTSGNDLDIVSFCVPAKPWVPSKPWEETMKFAS